MFPHLLNNTVNTPRQLSLNLSKLLAAASILLISDLSTFPSRCFSRSLNCLLIYLKGGHTRMRQIRLYLDTKRNSWPFQSTTSGPSLDNWHFSSTHIFQRPFYHHGIRKGHLNWRGQPCGLKGSDEPWKSHLWGSTEIWERRRGVEEYQPFYSAGW
jgi:hypothetical protein